MEWLGVLSSQQALAAYAAIAGFLLSLGLTLVTRLLAFKADRAKTEETEFEAAITSDDLQRLGNYLNSRLGTVSISTYLRDPTAHSRIDRYVARLADLVRLPEDTSKESQLQPPMAVQEPEVVLFDAFPTDPPPLVAALENLRQGETWTALARLRRDLEQRLRPISTGSVPTRGPVYQYIQDRDLAGITREFWKIASRAIHGDEISLDEAGYAIKLAREIYRHLEPSASLE